MLKTLAAKHQSTVITMAARYKAKIVTSDGPRTCFEARLQREGKQHLVARFGGIPLRHDRRAVITDPAPVPSRSPRKELIFRLRRRRCELCEQSTTFASTRSQTRPPRRPGPAQPAWAALMAKMRRKTLVVCAACHDDIHANPVATRGMVTGEPDAGKAHGRVCAVRRFVVSPTQLGGTRRNVPGSPGLPGRETVKGTRACQGSGGRLEASRAGCRKTRAIWPRLDCLKPNLQR